MIKKKKVTTEYVTNKALEKYLSEQTKTILEAVDFSLQKYSKKTDAKFEKIDARFKKIDDQFKIVNDRFNKVDARFDKLETELKSDINNVQTLIDGYVKAQEDFKQEFVIMKEEVRMMKLIFKEKLGVEIRAF
jgi:hypothetical protein